MRLVDAEKLDKKLSKIAREPNYWHEGEDWSVGVCIAQTELQFAPTIKAEPVKHGWWKSVGLASLKCSKCGFIDDHKMHFKNCPECRAKMDKKRR